MSIIAVSGTHLSDNLHCGLQFKLRLVNRKQEDKIIKNANKVACDQLSENYFKNKKLLVRSVEY